MTINERFGFGQCFILFVTINERSGLRKCSVLSMTINERFSLILSKTRFLIYCHRQDEALSILTMINEKFGLQQFLVLSSK